MSVTSFRNVFDRLSNNKKLAPRKKPPRCQTVQFEIGAISTRKGEKNGRLRPRRTSLCTLYVPGFSGNLIARFFDEEILRKCVLCCHTC